MAGVEVAFAANHSRHAVDVHTANHPGVIHECQDLRQFNFNKLDPFDILLASPSCQGHSKAGRQGRKKSKVAEKHDLLRSTAWAVIDCLEAADWGGQCEVMDSDPLVRQLLIERDPEWEDDE